MPAAEREDLQNLQGCAPPEEQVGETRSMRGDDKASRREHVALLFQGHRCRVDRAESVPMCDIKHFVHVRHGPSRRWAAYQQESIVTLRIARLDAQDASSELEVVHVV